MSSALKAAASAVRSNGRGRQRAAFLDASEDVDMGNGLVASPSSYSTNVIENEGEPLIDALDDVETGN